MRDYDKNSFIRERQDCEFQEFNPSMSKPIIDEIDRVLAGTMGSRRRNWTSSSTTTSNTGWGGRVQGPKNERFFLKVVKQSLQKARDSALLAVEVYNKPAVSFKSSGYITLMVIAWTSLFHAIFFQRRQKPFYRKSSGHYERVDDDYRYWELGECLKTLL